MMSKGVISEIIGMLPAMKMTEPYSPTARANASAKPVRSAGSMAGRITRKKVCSRFAPSEAAASSSSRSASSSTGCTVRTTKGKPMKISAITTPSGVKATRMPTSSSAAPSQPLGAYNAVSAIPATAVGKANGRSTSASTTGLPQKS